MDLHPFGIPKVTILSTFEIDRCSFKNMKEASEKQGDNRGSRLYGNINLERNQKFLSVLRTRLNVRIVSSL